jgi:hypothetical protein
MSRRRWPEVSAEAYAGDWRALYASRASMPHTVAANMDRIHALTLRAANPAVKLNSRTVSAEPVRTSSGGAVPHSPSKNVYGFSTRSFTRIPGMIFEEVAQLVYSVGMALVGAPEHRAGPDYRRLRADLAWWLAAKPEARRAGR